MDLTGLLHQYDPDAQFDGKGGAEMGRTMAQQKNYTSPGKTGVGI